jgi:hypothetical protein
LAGAGAGGLAGGLIGALVNLGVPEEEARDYQAGVERGGILLTARVPDGKEAEAHAVLDLVGTRDLDYHRGLWAREPSYRYDIDRTGDVDTGVGEATAAVLLAEVPDMKEYRSARKVAALAGLVPRERQSGSSIRGRVRLSKIGNARLRKALYFPAVTALRCSPFFQQWAEGLRQRGKSKMSVIGAAMRKLIHLAYGVLKTGQPFDPQWAKKA